MSFNGFSVAHDLLVVLSNKIHREVENTLYLFIYYSMVVYDFRDSVITIHLNISLQHLN